MQRTCPNCSQNGIPLSGLLVGPCRCTACGVTVQVNRAVSSLFSVLILVVTLVTSYMVLSLFGIYAVVVWFIFPIGAIGYLRARFCPLTVMPTERGPDHGF
jgi:uncharacterized protein (DUF983 family)